MGRAPAPLPQFGLEQLLVEALRNLRGALGWVDVDGGFAEIGHTGDAFAFDNEEPPHRVWLEPNRLADRLVTNGEWLAFITDGGSGVPSCGSPTAWPRPGPRGDGRRCTGSSWTGCGSSTP